MAARIDAPGRGKGGRIAAERALALEAAGSLGPALRAYEEALADAPDDVELLCGLARIAGRLGMAEQALALWGEVEARASGRADAASGRARALADLHRPGEAIETLRAAILANPGEPRLWNTLGEVVNDTGDSEAAHTFFDEAVRLDPHGAAALYNRGDVRFDLGRLAEAGADLAAAADRAAGPREAAVIAFARALLQLHGGELDAGWRGYEARLEPGFPDAPVFDLAGERWTPETPLAGADLLLVGEQGLGDEIMVLGLVPDVLAALGPEGRLALAVEPRLAALVQRSFPDAEVRPHLTERLGVERPRRRVAGEGEAVLWAPLGSLPRRFRPTLESFTPARAYLRPDPARVQRWRGWLGEGPAVGLSWRSGLQAGRRARHAPRLEDWRPLLASDGVRFVHLQYGATDAEVDRLDAMARRPLLRPPIDLKTELDELAALAVALDLVVSTPSATAALAAACGAETWFLTAPNAWPRLGTAGYPWYARARSFQAATFGDWAPVLAKLADALAERFSSAAGG